ncbi:MAG TPA: peptidylprolyl isomerase [Actinomycetota bacterium]
MRLRLLSLLAAASLVLSACTAFEPAAAVVGPHRIEDEEFLRLLDFIMADPQFAEAAVANPDVERATLQRQLLTFLIQHEVVEERAREEGIQVDRQRVEELMQDQAIQDQIGRSDATAQDVRAFVRAQLIRSDVGQAVVEDEASDERLQAAYEERAREFTEVHASHILVGSEEEASRIVAEATPSNFARLARELSDDQGSGANGGDLGTRAAGAYVPEFADALLELPEGRIGGPVETQFGFHVILVHSREAIPFEQAREQLLQELGPEVFREWMLERLRSLTVRVNPRYGTFDEDTGEVVERRATTPLPGPQTTP